MEDNAYDLAIVDPQTGQGEDKKHASRNGSVKQKNGSTHNRLTHYETLQSRNMARA